MTTLAGEHDPQQRRCDVGSTMVRSHLNPVEHQNRNDPLVAYA